MNKVMENLKISTGDYPPAGEPFTAVVATNRQALIDLLDECKESGGGKGYFEISMPCGYSKIFKKHADIPFEDLLCPCGTDGHYLIKYKKE